MPVVSFSLPVSLAILSFSMLDEKYAYIFFVFFMPTEPTTMSTTTTTTMRRRNRFLKQPRRLIPATFRGHPGASNGYRVTRLLADSIYRSRPVCKGKPNVYKTQCTMWNCTFLVCIADFSSIDPQYEKKKERSFSSIRLLRLFYCIIGQCVHSGSNVSIENWLPT